VAAEYTAPAPSYDSPVEETIAISQPYQEEPEAAAPSSDSYNDLVAAAPTYTPVAEEAPQPATPDVVQEPIQSYFIPAEPVAVPDVEVPAVQEDYLSLQWKVID
jgi:hypothetical protein